MTGQPRTWEACETCGKPSPLVTVWRGRLACPDCHDAAWDAQIDREADRFEAALNRSGPPLPTGDAPLFA